MSDSTSKKSKGSFTITMPIDKKLVYGEAQFSPTHRDNGFAWRLHVTRTCAPDYTVALHCNSEGRSELWKVNSKISKGHGTTQSFASWRQDCNKYDIVELRCPEYKATEVSIDVEWQSESFACRPILDLKSIPDVILLLEGQKFPVNKQMLSSQSTYFNKLFFSDFKESKQEEIELKDDPEDFHELLKMIYGISTEPTTVENAIRYLTMADKFDLQIVKGRVENFLLSTSLISIHRKFLLAEEHNLKMLKKEVLLLYTKKENLHALRVSPELGEFSIQQYKELFGIACDLIG